MKKKEPNALDTARMKQKMIEYIKEEYGYTDQQAEEFAKQCLERLAAA
jgi:hypothetical protein